MQLKLSQEELDRIGRHVEQHYRSAIRSHQERMSRFRRYYRTFRGLVDPPLAGDEDASNYQVPLLKWHVFNKWADLSRVSSWAAAPKRLPSPPDPTTRKSSNAFPA